MRLFRTCLAIALACVGSAAAAQSAPAVAAWPIEEKRLASGKATIDPTMGYVFVHGPERLMLKLIKVPTAEEIAAHDAEWRRRLAEAQAEYPERLRKWKRDKAAAAEMRRNFNVAPPVEPTEANVSIGSLEQQMVVTVGPQYVYAKADGAFSYLHALAPGTYVYYGSFALHGRGWLIGTCMCMGAVSFEVEAGRITNLGDFPTMRWVTAQQALASDVQLEAQEPPVPIDFTLPERLAALPNADPDWRAHGKINNFLGVVIGRTPPMAGVLAYERDRIVDLKAAPEEGTGGGL